MKRYIFIAVGLIIILAGWFTYTNTIGSTKYKYGIAFDKERMERKIPVIGDTAYSSDDWAHAWKYPIKSKGHRYKYFSEKDGEIISEIDGYQSGIKYTKEDGSQGEEYIQITYSYESERSNLNPWSAIYYFKDGQHELTLQKAEEILNNWGINRLD